MDPNSSQSVLCPSSRVCIQSGNRTWFLQGLIVNPSDNPLYNLTAEFLSGGDTFEPTPVSTPEPAINVLDDTCLQASINTFLQRYITPVIIFVGVFGNMMSLAVFRTSRLRRQTSTVHLSALAMSDTGFLITLLLSWLGWFRVNLVHQQPWCVLVVYVTYMCSFLSVWIVVTFTVERFIVACFPLHRKRILRPKTTKIILATLILVALLAYSFALWMNGVINVAGTNMCGYYPQYERVVRILMHIDTAITFVIPMIIIITLNSAIAMAVYRTQRSLARSSAGGGGSTHSHTKRCGNRPTVLTYLELSGSNSTYRSFNANSHNHPQQQLRKRDVVVSLSSCNMSSQERAKRHIRATKMLLVVSTVFVVLNLPVHTMKVHAVVTHMVDPTWVQPQAERLWIHTFELVYYCNFAINFFLYSLCAQNFRRCLIASCLKIKAKLICCLTFRMRRVNGANTESSGQLNSTLHQEEEERAGVLRIKKSGLKDGGIHGKMDDVNEAISDWSSTSRS